jgi:glutathione S-transferase
VLRDGDVVVPESTTILEYLARHHGGVPADGFEIRARDRFFDNYVMDPMQRIVSEIRKPVDAAIIEGAKQTLFTAYRHVDGWLADRTWACGDTFTMADCAAAPSLFYANELVPIEAPHTRAYLERLLARPSMIRVRAEAQPYWQYFPGRRV